MDTLYAIKDYNSKLKPARKEKDKLPEIVSTNISTKERYVKDYKKQKINLDRNYVQVGILDGGEATELNGDKYSLSAKQRSIQRASSQQRIDTIRTSYAKLLGITPPVIPSDPNLKPTEQAAKPIPMFVDGFTRKRLPEEPSNPFTPQKLSSAISLSVFNRPSSMAARRPQTAYTQEDLVKKLPGWKPPPVKASEDAPPEPEPTEKREPILPEFSMSKEFDFISKDATDSQRQVQFEEIEQIRSYLAKPQTKRDDKDKTQSINIPIMKKFESAILMPAEHQDNLDKKKYPTYGEFLMVNPFPKKKKKKKGKGKKKR